MGLNVTVEDSFEIIFRNHKVGKYISDLIVENLIIVELKCCKALLPEHQAQLINYLKASGLPIGLLVNFGNHKLEYKRLHHPNDFIEPKFTQELFPFPMSKSKVEEANFIS